MSGRLPLHYFPSSTTSDKDKEIGLDKVIREVRVKMVSKVSGESL